MTCKRSSQGYRRADAGDISGAMICTSLIAPRDVSARRVDLSGGAVGVRREVRRLIPAVVQGVADVRVQRERLVPYAGPVERRDLPRADVHVEVVRADGRDRVESRVEASERARIVRRSRSTPIRPWPRSRRSRTHPSRSGMHVTPALPDGLHLRVVARRRPLPPPPGRAPRWRGWACRAGWPSRPPQPGRHMRLELIALEPSGT